MKFEDVNQAVKTIQTLDERRREAFKTEYQDTNTPEYSFENTRRIISEEQDALADLDELLETERNNVDKLIDETEFLTVDQAVKHRDQTVSKINDRNKHLKKFHHTMSEALTIIESNLDEIKKEGDSAALDADPTQYLEDAQVALQDHNEAIRGLESNLKILNAYLL